MGTQFPDIVIGRCIIQSSKPNSQHHQLKAAEYAKKGYAFGYVKPAVYAAPHVAAYAAPVATYAHTYAAPVATYAHHLGKREAEADSQYVYNAGVYADNFGY